METFTVELCTAEGDPYDRTLGVLVKSGRHMLMARSMRVAPNETLGSILLTVDRLVLAWGIPQLKDSEHLHDTWDSEQRRIGAGPFDD